MNAEALKIGKEADEANAIATQVQLELDKAMPALLAAEEALNVLTKKDMAELKAYAKPPALVEITLSGGWEGGGRLIEGKGVGGRVGQRGWGGRVG